MAMACSPSTAGHSVTDLFEVRIMLERSRRCETTWKRWLVSARVNGRWPTSSSTSRRELVVRVHRLTDAAQAPHYRGIFLTATRAATVCRRTC
jgi:hypothetical protein